MSRVPWPDYWMRLAHHAATRATCPRRAVGAVLVSPANRLIASGYNGSVAGLPHCEDAGCLLDDAGHCIRTLHAEQNALLECGPHERRGATLYCTDHPCATCTKLILTSGIVRVVWDRSYAVPEAIRDMIAASGVVFTPYQERDAKQARLEQMERFLAYHGHIEEFYEVLADDSLWMHRYVNGEVES